MYQTLLSVVVCDKQYMVKALIFVYKRHFQDHHMQMSRVISWLFWHGQHPFCSFAMYSGWSSRVPLPFHLSILITEFFWDRADSFSLFAIGTSSSWSPTRLVLHTTSQLLEVSKQLMLVPPSSARFKIMGDPGILPPQLSCNRKFRREGRCPYAILQSFDISFSSDTTMGSEILNFNKYISGEEIRLQ